MTMEKMIGVKTVDPRTLKNHSLNITLYGEDIPPHLVDSIKQYGVRDPIVVCRSSNMDLDNVVVSGRRRRVIAIKCGLKSVPIIEWPCDDEEELKQQLIISNIRSELTIEQRGRMMVELVESETRMAAKRRVDSGKGVAVANPGRADEKAAEQVGLKRSTARRVTETIKNVDAMKAAGDDERAAAVVEKLNKGQVTAALRESSAPKPVENVDTNKDVSAKIELIVKHERLLRESVVAAMLAFDNKHRDDPEFSRFAKFESIMRGISESQERPKVEVERLKTEWAKFVSRNEE